jgi:hypothetical protein
MYIYVHSRKTHITHSYANTHGPDPCRENMHIYIHTYIHTQVII